jgi:hypothetical protein
LAGGKLELLQPPITISTAAGFNTETADNGKRVDGSASNKCAADTVQWCAEKVEEMVTDRVDNRVSMDLQLSMTRLKSESQN